MQRPRLKAGAAVPYTVDAPRDELVLFSELKLSGDISNSALQTAHLLVPFPTHSAPLLVF